VQIIYYYMTMYAASRTLSFTTVFKTNLVRINCLMDESGSQGKPKST